MKIPVGYFVIVIAVALGMSGLKTLLAPEPTQRPLEIFTEMVYSKASESFSESAYLPDRMTQQHLVEGVVPRGSLGPKFGTSTEEAQRAGRELTNPILADDLVALETGRKLYGIYCTVCHDPKGDGMGPVVLRGMLPPPSLHAVRALELPDGELFHILSYGQGNMASYATQLSAQERWQVIRYVRSLQEKGAR